MKALLEFLFRFCLPLFDKHAFRFRDSSTGPNLAAGAWILLDSKDVQIQISHEQDELIWYIRSMYDLNKKNWFSIDLLSRLLGRSTDTGLMDEANSIFLSQNIDEIITRFRKEKYRDTIDELNKLKAERAERM